MPSEFVTSQLREAPVAATMCTVWLELDSVAASAYASTARRISTPAHRGTAILFGDGSAGYLRDWRQPLGVDKRAMLKAALNVHLYHLQRNWWSRVLNYYEILHVRSDIEALKC